MTDSQAYFEYLRGRSWRALLFRRFWLYPRFCRDVRGHVLDVGCGVGDLLRYRPNTTGVDVNPVTVAWCQSQGLDARIMAPDRLPFGNAEFDGAVLDNVLEHLAHPMPLLAEIRRVIVPNGILIVGVPGRRGYTRDADHKTFYDETSLLTIMEQVGFAHVRHFYVPFRNAWLDRTMRQYCLYGVFRRGRD